MESFPSQSTGHLNRLLTIGEIFDTAITLAIKNGKTALALSIPIGIVLSLITPTDAFEKLLTQAIHNPTGDLQLGRGLIPFPPVLTAIVSYLAGFLLSIFLSMVFYSARLNRQLDLKKTMVAILKNGLSIILKNFVVFVLFTLWGIAYFVVVICVAGGFGALFVFGLHRFEQLGILILPSIVFIMGIAFAGFAFFLLGWSLVLMSMGEIIFRRASFGRLFTFPLFLLRSKGFIKRGTLFGLAQLAVEVGLMIIQGLFAGAVIMLLAGKNDYLSQVLSSIMYSILVPLQYILRDALRTVFYQDSLQRFERIPLPWPAYAVPLNTSDRVPVSL